MRRPVRMWLLVLALMTAAGCARPDSGPAPVTLPDPAAGVLHTPNGDVRLGTLVVDRQVTVLAGGQVRDMIRFISTDRFADLHQQEAAAVQSAARAGWTVDAGQEDGRHVVTLSREYPDFDLFNRDNPGSLERVPAPLYEVIRYRGMIEGVVEDVAAYYPPPAGVSSDEYARFLRSAVHFSVRVTLPGKVSSHSMDLAEGPSARWTHPAADVGVAGVALTAEARVYKRWPLYVFAGVTLFLVGGAILIRATRRWWDSDEDEGPPVPLGQGRPPTPSGGGAAAPAAPPGGGEAAPAAPPDGSAAAPAAPPGGGEAAQPAGEPD